MRAALAIFVLFGANSFAQVSSTVSLSNGVQVRISAQPSPAPSSGLKIGMAPASGNSFYRIYRDENELAVFAYVLGVERSADGTQFRVTARPAGTDFAARFPNADAGKPVPTLSEPRQSSQLNPGDQFTIDVPTNPGLQQNITDVVQVRLSQRGVSPEIGTQSSAQLRFVALQVRAGGRLLTSSASGAVVIGRYVMFYVPGHGGYFFSAEPVSGHPFAQIGIVDGTKLKFTVANQDYECDSEAPILVKSDGGEIWVYHDPNYKPAGNWTKSDTREESRDQFFTAASDSLGWWLG